MFKELVKSIIKYKKDKCILALQLSENLKNNIKDDLIAAYEISEPLVAEYMQEFKNSSSFFNFLIDILHVPFLNELDNNTLFDRDKYTNQELEKCKRELQKCMTEYHSLKTELDFKDSEILQSQNNKSDLEQKFIDYMKNSKTKDSQEYEELNSEFSKCKWDLKQMMLENESLQKQLEANNESHLRDLIRKNKDLEERLNSLNAKIIEYDNANDITDHMTLQTENMTLQRENINLQSQISHLNAELLNVNTKNSKDYEYIKKIQSENVNLDRQVKESELAIGTLKQQETILQNETKRLGDKIETLKALIKEEREKYNLAYLESNTFQNTLETLKSESENHEYKFQNEREFLNNEILRLRNLIKKETEKAATQITELQDEIAMLKSQLKTNESKLQNEKDKREALNKIIKVKQEEIENITDESIRFQGQLEILKKQSEHDETTFKNKNKMFIEKIQSLEHLLEKEKEKYEKESTKFQNEANVNDYQDKEWEEEEADRNLAPLYDIFKTEKDFIHEPVTLNKLANKVRDVFQSVKKLETENAELRSFYNEITKIFEIPKKMNSANLIQVPHLIRDMYDDVNLENGDLKAIFESLIKASKNKFKLLVPTLRSRKMSPWLERFKTMSEDIKLEEKEKQEHLEKKLNLLIDERNDLKDALEQLIRVFSKQSKHNINLLLDNKEYEEVSREILDEYNKTVTVANQELSKFQKNIKILKEENDDLNEKLTNEEAAHNDCEKNLVKSEKKYQQCLQLQKANEMKNSELSSEISELKEKLQECKQNTDSLQSMLTQCKNEKIEIERSHDDKDTDRNILQSKIQIEKEKTADYKNKYNEAMQNLNYQKKINDQLQEEYDLKSERFNEINTLLLNCQKELTDVNTQLINNEIRHAAEKKEYYDLHTSLSNCLADKENLHQRVQVLENTKQHAENLIDNLTESKSWDANIREQLKQEIAKLQNQTKEEVTGSLFQNIDFLQNEKETYKKLYETEKNAKEKLEQEIAKTQNQIKVVEVKNENDETKFEKETKKLNLMLVERDEKITWYKKELVDRTSKHELEIEMLKNKIATLDTQLNEYKQKIKKRDYENEEEETIAKKVKKELDDKKVKRDDIEDDSSLRKEIASLKEKLKDAIKDKYKEVAEVRKQEQIKFSNLQKQCNSKVDKITDNITDTITKDYKEKIKELQKLILDKDDLIVAYQKELEKLQSETTIDTRGALFNNSVMERQYQSLLELCLICVASYFHLYNNYVQQQPIKENTEKILKLANKIELLQEVNDVEKILKSYVLMHLDSLMGVKHEPPVSENLIIREYVDKAKREIKSVAQIETLFKKFTIPFVPKNLNMYADSLLIFKKLLDCDTDDLLYQITEMANLLDKKFSAYSSKVTLLEFLNFKLGEMDLMITE